MRDFKTIFSYYRMSQNGIISIDILPYNLRYIHHLNELIVSFFSFLTNSIFILILLTERNTMLKTYTHVLLQTCIVDLIYTFATVLAEVVSLLLKNLKT